MKKPLTACIAIVLLSFVSHAQDGRTVFFRTLCLEKLKEIENVVIPIADGGPSADIPLYTDVSPVVQGVFKTDEAAFYVVKTGADGKPALEMVGKGTMGKSDRQLFVFLPGEGGKGKPTYQVRCFDDDTKTFAMGSVRAINLAPVPVRFVLSGATTPEIPPTKYAMFPHSKQVNDYNMYPVVVEFLSGTGEWIKGQSVSWKATGRRREIVLTLVDSRFKQPVVRMFTDFPPWMESTLASAPRRQD